MRQRYARLLRWYPKGWRQTHGRLMLDTLDEHAHDRGIARPGLAEAWSIRAHGLGERATIRWAVTAAVVSLAGFILATAILLSDAMYMPGAGVVRTTLAVLVGPLFLTFAVLILLHRRGQLSAPAALCGAVAAVPAFALAALAAASWSVGFDEADAGMGRSWFGSATLLFIVLAWLTATVSLFAPTALLVGRKLPVMIRLPLIGLLAAILAAVVGVLMVTGQMMGSVAAAAVLALAVLSGRPGSVRPGSVGPAGLALSVQVAEQRSSPGQAAGLTRSAWAIACVAGLFSFVAGLGCAVFALTGSIWSPGVTDSTHAMNLGLAAGALAAIPAAVAAGVIFTPRFGKIMRWAVLLLSAALAVEAAAQFAGAGHPLQWPMTVAAAVMLSLSFALPVSGLVSSKPAVRFGVAAALGLAGSMPALMVVSAAAFIAPPVAAILVVWSWRRLSAGRGRQVPRTA